MNNDIKENEELQLIRLSEIEPQEVKWLWEPYLPLGKITVLQGDPGEGKTMLALHISALLSRGLALPEQTAPNESICVIYQTAEDGLADTIRPRLESAGADLKRIIVIDDSLKPLSFSDERIEQAIVRANAKLCILDPLQAFLGNCVDMHRANEVRPVLRTIADTAQRTNCAVLIIGHMNKKSGTKGIYRGLGSVDIPAIARSILYIGKDKEQQDLRYFAQLKNSFAPLGDTLKFSIADALTYEGKSDVKADILLSECSELNPAVSKADTVVEELIEMLSEKPKLSSEIFAYFKDKGVSPRTLESAKKKAGIVSKKNGSQWFWILPQ